MKRNTHVIDPAPAFRLTTSADGLSEYKVRFLNPFLMPVDFTDNPLI